MEIFLLRHGIAEDMSQTGRDEDRRLTDKGIERLRNCARVFKTLKVRADTVLASPYLRAQETAKILLEQWSQELPLITTEALVPHAPGTKVLEELSEIEAESVLLVGHEPHLSRLVSLLISGGTDISVTMKKGSLCKLTSPLGAPPYPGTATLEWLLAPKHLLNSHPA